MLYYVISTSEDGDVGIEAMTRDDLLERLAEDYWGGPEHTPVRQLKPGQRVDLRESHGIYIIAGENILPQPLEVVKTWTV
jgi:hypothetical protein